MTVECLSVLICAPPLSSQAPAAMTHEDTEEMQPLRSHSRHCSVPLITFQSQGLELSPLRGGEGAGEATQPVASKQQSFSHDTTLESAKTTVVRRSFSCEQVQNRLWSGYICLNTRRSSPLHLSNKEAVDPSLMSNLPNPSQRVTVALSNAAVNRL